MKRKTMEIHRRHQSQYEQSLNRTADVCGMDCMTSRHRTTTQTQTLDCVTEAPSERYTAAATLHLL